MAIGDVYRVALEQRYRGHAMVNTFHYLVGNEGTTTNDEIALAQQFDDQVASEIALAQVTAVTYDRIVVQKVWPLPVLAFQTYTPGAGPAVSGAGVPDTVAAVFQRRGALAKRSNMGRIFVGGLPQAWFVGATGKWDPAQGPQFTAIANALDSSLTATVGGAIYEPCLFNRATGATVLIEKTNYDTIPRSQRRRELDRGI